MPSTPPTPSLEIPPEAQRAFDALLQAEPAPIDALRTELAAYAQRVSTPEDDALVDATLGRALARSCEGLLDHADAQGDPQTHRLVQAAVRYFIAEDDGDPDEDSMWGLDDDAAVCNAVARHLGLEALVVTVD